MIKLLYIILFGSFVGMCTSWSKEDSKGGAMEP